MTGHARDISCSRCSRSPYGSMLASRSADGLPSPPVTARPCPRCVRVPKRDSGRPASGATRARTELFFDRYAATNRLLRSIEWSAIPMFDHTGSIASTYKRSRRRRRRVSRSTRCRRMGRCRCSDGWQEGYPGRIIRIVLSVRRLRAAVVGMKPRTGAGASRTRRHPSWASSAARSGRKSSASHGSMAIERR